MKYIKNQFINLIKGICIGIAIIIPGFSGGTMAVILKIYDLFVYCLGNIFNDFKNVIKKGWGVFVGIVLGVLLSLVTIVKLLEIAPFTTSMFFVGLVIGSLDDIYNSVKKEKVKLIDIVFLLLAIVIMVILPLQKEKSIEINYDFKLYINMFLMGAICSSAMVIPGVSGSLVLMAFGYYSFVLSNIKELLVNLFNFSNPNYFELFFTVFFFGLGCILGITLVGKLIKHLIDKQKRTVTYTILGLLLASPFAIIYLTALEYPISLNVFTTILSIISMFIGIAISYFGNKISKKS